MKTINLQSLISNLQPKLFGLLLITFCLHTFFIWPNYISYFNWLVGGQQHGWRILSDSNVDWGQDLVALANWQHKTGLPLKLSYFGTAYPSAYGLQFESLPTWEPGPEQTAPQRQAFYPSDPAPGFYAISVTNLHGVVLGERPQTFAYFREKEPIFKAGNSIFVYEVKPTGDPVQVALSGITPAGLPAAFHDQFGSNDVNVRWFNESTGSIYAPGGMWQVTQEGSAVDVHGFPFSIQSTDLFVWEGWQLRWLSPAEPGNHAVLANFGLAELVDLQSLTVEEGRIQLRTIWRVQQSTPRPLKIFVHALDAQAEIVGQSDVLDVDSRSWAAGDWVSQTHDFTLSATPVSLRIGLYDSRTGERLAAPFAAPYPLAPIP